jgi:Dna[CI] antecedent, DciA
VKPSQTLYPRPNGLAGYLERLPQLRPGLSQARASLRSEHSLKECLPPKIAQALHSIHSSGSGLVISVTSAEAAHWVRLLRPEIERSLADKGLKFNEILVNVQSEMLVRHVYRPRPGAQAIKQLQVGAEKMQSERLQTSLARLAKTLK